MPTLVNNHGDISGGAVSHTLSWSGVFTPTSGNLLVICFGNSSGAADIASIDGDWTLIHANNGSGRAMLGGWAYKVSDGTETSFDISWTTSFYCDWFVCEISGLAAVSPLDQKAEDESNNSSVSTSCSTGTTATLSAADDWALSFFLGDTNAWGATSRTYTNSSTDFRTKFDNVAMFLAAKTLSTTTGFSETVTTSTSDQCYGSVAVFKQAGGATTIEAALTFAASLSAVSTSSAVYQAALTYQSAQSATPAASAVFETSALFASALATTPAAGSVLEVAATFAAALAAQPDADVSIEAAASFVQELAQTSTGNAQLDAALALSKVLTTQYTTGATVDASLTFAIAQQVAQSANAILEAAATYANAQGMDNGNIATLNAVQSFALNQAIDLAAVADLSVSIALGVEQGFVSDGTVLTGVTIVEAALALNMAQTMQLATGGDNTWEPKLTIGLVQSIDAISVANLFAASTFGSQLALTLSGGGEIEAAISYAIAHEQVQTVGLAIDGSVELGISQAVAGVAQADLTGAVTLTHQVVVQSVANAVLNAGLSLSSIQNVVTNGSVLQLEVVLPGCRTITVQAESRIIGIQAETRTIDVKGCGS